MREWWEEHKDYIEGFIGFGLLLASGYFAILIGYAAGLN